MPAKASDQAVKFAQAHLGDGAASSYGLFGANDEVGGGNGRSILNGRGAPKCNFLVYDAYESAGTAPKLSDGSIPRTIDWYNPRARIVGPNEQTFDIVHQSKDGPIDPTKLQPGDIITNGHHMGIYAPGPDGPTISAATPNERNWLPEDRNHPWLGGVTRNDWGFRSYQGEDGEIVVRRLAQR